jgi:hypothetical protein
MKTKEEKIPAPRTGLLSSEKKPKDPSDIYKVEKVEGGWKIYYYYPRDQYTGTIKRPVDDGYLYLKRQSAYRRCKHLNDTRHSANIFTCYAKLTVRRENCLKVIDRLRTGVQSFIVHDPLKSDEKDIRYITCQQRCRWSEDDFDPQVKQFLPQPKVVNEFYAFLDTMKDMPEVEALERSEHSFQIYYP